VTLAAGVDDIRFGITMALAIALHNIPEGIAVALPIYTATHNRRSALSWTLVAGLAEPIGTLLGIALILTFPAPWLIGGLFGAVAGIMLYISFDEILPMAYQYDKGHIAIYGVLTGMIMMAMSLILV